jgi:hypothetical protein
MKKTIIAVLIASMLLIPLTIGGCNSKEGFAIYLTRDDIPVSQMPALSHVEIADEPVISADDIVTYIKDSHEIELTAEAYERVNLKAPPFGKSFVVCVDKQPIYWGAFWTSFSSQSFDGVTIMIPPFPPGELSANSIRIGLGYPGEGFFQGEDSRSNPEILQSLEKAGKLK